MARVLGIGIAALDIINEIDGYPPEDAEVRAVRQRVSGGGNAVNTLAVLSILGHQCAFGGVLAREPDADRLRLSIERYGIDLSPCRVETNGKTPTSYICLNIHNGSRTIVHYRDLPEFACKDFRKIDLTDFDWLHFEGRNIVETRSMFDWVVRERPNLPLSIEIEKPRAGIETLFDGPRVLLFSRHYLYACGHQSPIAFLRALSKQIPHADLVCAWGEAGGYALSSRGVEYYSPAYPPTQVVDTLGAGDTFNAGIIDGLVRGGGLEHALIEANKLAGRKCGFVGFEGLRPKTIGSL